ncbi:AAA family ATPase [Desulfosporosinus sp. SB140]|uniref:AAA family ATPase n=1 Tax=Desulfosporosinus paludis TaxID=3115649 RepID=UPI00388F7AFA
MLKKLEVNNFTVFKKISIEFSGGIDIFIGENGTGKTHLLKILYACCNKNENDGKAFASYFSSSGWAPLKRNDSLKNGAVIRLLDERNTEITSINGNNMTLKKPFLNKNIKSVFIPAKEMLSHSKGLLALDREREIPFDKTLIDIVSKAELGESKSITEFQKTLLLKLSKVIEGEVIYENDTFYIKKENGLKVEFSMEAEGLRKFGLLWKLIRNGLLDRDSILLWDEPEANINPQLIPILVDIILELHRKGVQVFLATHDYNLAKYFEVNRNKGDKVIFHSFFKSEDGVGIDTKEYFGMLNNNSIIKADEQLLDTVFEKNLGD